MATNKLSATQIKAATYSGKARKLFDGSGLYLHVQSSGRYWRLKYRYDGKEKLLALGVYPEVSLKEAREKRDEARQLLADGIDPSVQRRTNKLLQTTSTETTLHVIAKEWFETKKTGWSVVHAKRTWARVESYILPALGKHAIDEIEPSDVLAVLRPIQASGKVETAHRIRVIIGQVFRYALATSRVRYDPTVALRDALMSASSSHFAAATEPKRVGEILRMIDGYEGSPIVRGALRLAPLLFVRPGELRTMRWADIDIDLKEWRFIVSKTGRPILVPLASQALEILHELEPLTRHQGEFVFAGMRSPTRPLSDMALGAALRRLGIDTRTEHTTHGWRATARTLLHERLSYPPDVIEHQLSHSVPDRLGGAYNRTRFVQERRQMMQDWADYLDSLR